MIFDFIRGGQILSHNIEMFKQVVRKLIIFSFIITFLFFVFKIKNEIKLEQIRNTYYYIIAENYVRNNQQNKLIRINKNFNKNIPDKKIDIKAIDIVKNNFLEENKNKTLMILHKNFIISSMVYIITFISIILIFLLNGYLVNRDKFLRGAKIVSVKVLNNFVKKYNKINKKKFIKTHKNIFRKSEQIIGVKNKYNDYSIAGAIYPFGTETNHTIITGASGTGKTVLITDLINQIRNNGDRAIIYDRMGTFVSKFYNGDDIEQNINKVKNDNNLSDNRKSELLEYYSLKKDIILNPIDARSPYWSIFNEVRDSLDFDNIASALIPENASNVDPFWNVAARILFSSVANRLKEDGKTSNKDLIDKLLKINLQEAAQLVVGTPAQSIIDENNPKTALSVMSMISTNLKSLIHLRDKKIEINCDNEITYEENEFSIRKWIQDDNQENFLFISSRADRHDTLKPLISTWLDIAINSLLSLKQSNDRKIWIIIDELPSLYYLPSLHTGLAESRQFGGCFVLSMQLMAQLRAIYGKEKAESTSGLCRNRVILNTPDEDTAKWCSENLGKAEFQEIKENISFGANDLKDGVNINKQNIQKTIILPTEIMQLPNLETYIKFAGNFPITKSKFKYKYFSEKAERYIENIIANTNINKINDNKGGLDNNLNDNNKNIENNSINKNTDSELFD